MPQDHLPPPPFRNQFGKNRKKTVLLLCTGNTCRSPMAAAYLRDLIEKAGIDNIAVRSAGVMTVTGLRASPEASQIMEELEIDLGRHRSSQLSPEMIRRADLILGMSPLHVQTAVRLSEEARDKTFLLKEYTGSDLKNIQIPDPMGATLEVFRRVFLEIRAACDLLAGMEVITGEPPKVKPHVRTRAAATTRSTGRSKPGAKTAKAASNGAATATATKKNAKSADKATAKSTTTGKKSASGAKSKTEARAAGKTKTATRSKSQAPTAKSTKTATVAAAKPAKSKKTKTAAGSSATSPRPSRKSAASRKVQQKKTTARRRGAAAGRTSTARK